MSVKESAGVIATVEVEVWGPNRPHEKIQRQNRFTDQGLNFFAEKVLESTGDFISYLAVGESDSDVSDTASSLDDELIRKEVDTERTDNELKFGVEWLDGAAEGAHREAGLFLADEGDSDDEMISRVTFPVRNIGPDDSIIYRWYVTFKRAE